MFKLHILQELGLEFLMVYLCSAILYYSGDVMRYISDNHKEKEWINQIIAFIDIILIAIDLVLVIRMLIIIIPYVLMFLIGAILLLTTFLIISLIVHKIIDMIRK